MKIIWASLMGFLFLCAAGLVTAQTAHVTPITTSVFLYNDGPVMAQSPTAVPDQDHEGPHLWTTPGPAKTHKHKNHPKVYVRSTPTPIN